MAFVYQKARWEEETNEQTDSIGPGSYFSEEHWTRSKNGYISPENIKTANRALQKIQQMKRHTEIQLILKEKAKNNRTQRGYTGKLRSPPRFDRNIRGKENQLEAEDLIQNIEAKNKIPKRYLHTSQSYKQSKMRRQEIMKIMHRRRDIPSLAQEQHQDLCVNIQRKNNRSKLMQSRKKMNKMSHSYNMMPKTSMVQPSGQKLFVLTSYNFQSEEAPIRKLQTSESKVYRSVKTAEKLSDQPQSYMKYNDERPTGIQDDSGESSIEYIDDATPGPGAYDLRVPIVTSKKSNSVEKFGITVKRFDDPKKIVNEFYSQQEPVFKKGSKASQGVIAFGRSMKEAKRKEMEHGQMIYQEDKGSIQYRSCQNLLKSYISPGNFLSKNERFGSEKSKQYYGPDFYLDGDNRLDQQEEIVKPQANFLSQAQRITKIHAQTLDADFRGQDYNTIELKLKDKVKLTEDIDRKPAAFLKDAPRFKGLKPEQLQEKAKPFNQLAQKMKKSKEKPKGYSFRKGQYTQNFATQNGIPPVAKYNTNEKWVKHSFNRKFQN